LVLLSLKLGLLTLDLKLLLLEGILARVNLCESCS
jgi:hypothetical protein